MAMNDKSRRELHPAVSILSWLILALAIELASTAQLLWFAALALLLIARADAASRFVQLSWKARWLWLALIIMYAWTVPGTLLWPHDWSPTREGLLTGTTRIARLLLMLAVLARLLSEFSARQLSGGIYLLSKPLGWMGLDRRALAVRLALTLEHMEQPAREGNWLERLQSPMQKTSGPDEIRVAIALAGKQDVMIFLAAAALLGIVLLGVAA